MCNFFSFATDEYGKKYYFNWEQRTTLKTVSGFDSHSSICEYYKVNEDKINKYEYNPLTETFIIDQINSTVDDRVKAEKWVRKLDFSTVVKPLRIKPIVDPLRKKASKPTKRQVAALHEWASVRDSVRDSVGASVRDSVWDSVGDSVRDSVWDSVGASVGASVRDSVGASVGASVRDSVWDSVWASVWAYISSFVDTEYEYDFASINALWESGLVPSFDGKIWRLHSGKNADIVYEWKPDEK